LRLKAKIVSKGAPDSAADAFFGLSAGMNLPSSQRASERRRILRQFDRE
jgi:hypothetical protein